MFERFTDRAREVVTVALEEAAGLNHDHIGTEHLLLAAVRVPDTVAARALESLGLTLQAVRQQVEEVVGRGQGDPPGHVPFTPRGKKALELSLQEALHLRHNYIGTEHILLGIIREGEGAAISVLDGMGVSRADLRGRLMDLLTGAGDEAAAGKAQGDEPRCARCDTEVADHVRGRAVPVAGDSSGEIFTSVTLLWCGLCGAVIAAMPPSD